LFLHFYFYGCKAFNEWEWTAKLSGNILKNIARSGLFTSFTRSKCIALGFLVVSLIGASAEQVFQDFL
jgi:hypothetical protein